VLILLNGWQEPVPFELPPAPGGGHWQLRIDTTDPALGSDGAGVFERYVATGRSVVVFATCART
jgi:isoamylase